MIFRSLSRFYLILSVPARIRFYNSKALNLQWLPEKQGFIYRNLTRYKTIMKKLLPPLLTITGVLLLASPTLACRYNVRDAGYVFLGVKPYFLYCYVNNDTPKDTIDTLQKTLDEVLTYTNLYGEIININQQQEHPSMKYLPQKKNLSLPTAMLLSPSEQVLQLNLNVPGQSLQQTLRSKLAYILSSPLRKQIAEQLTQAYAVILVIEGPDPQENQKALKTASEAIEVIKQELDYLPKSIANPPVSVTLDTTARDQEKILLWSFSLASEKITETTVIILYGRGRQMGPALKQEQINQVWLVNLLALIGADCECNLDRSWMLGPMMPFRWDEKLQQKIAENLGFDTENPMIKMEIAHILRRGYYSFENMTGGELSDVPAEYQELVIDFDSNSPPPSPAPAVSPPASSRGKNAPKKNNSSSDIDSQIKQEQCISFQNSFYVFIGVTILVLVSGIIIFRKNMQKNKN